MTSDQIPKARSSFLKDPLTYHALTLGTFLAASAAPTPLYRFYQEAFAVSPAVTALVFAVYAFALLKALLIAGSISDHLGRRPVIFGAIVVEMAAMALFMTASGPAWLIAARFVQGLATGIATASIAAALIDFDRAKAQTVNSIAPLVGMALGACITSALVQFGPAPLHLTYGILLIIFTFLGIAIWLTPETVEKRPGVLASLRPRASVPPQAKRAMALITPLNTANWMLGGFYLSLVPSIVVATTGSRAPLTGGGVVTALMLAGTIANLMRRKKSAQQNLSASVVVTAFGIVIVLFGVHLASVPLLILGTLACGAGFGLNFLGCLGSIMPLAKAEERAELLSAFYIQSYLAFSLPAILAGFLAKWLGYTWTADIYTIAILSITLLGILGLRAGRTKAAVPAQCG